MTDLHFNRDFIKIDLMKFEISKGYVQNSGMCIINLDSIDTITKSDMLDMYVIHVSNTCYYISEEQFKTLCDKL